MKHTSIAGAIAAACFAFSAPGAASADSAAPPTLSVSGSGSVSYAPDISQLSFGVRAESESAATAAKSVDSRASSVIAALRNLPERQREVIVLRYYADLSEAEIASAMKISRGAVKSHTSRGMAALRAALEQDT